MKGASFLLLLIFSFLYFHINGLNAKTLLPGEESYAAFAEVMPEPVGGLSQINKKISYPDFAKRAGAEGKVFVLAFINENGDVDDVKLIKGIGMGCDEEVLRAVKSSKFKPGMNKGVPIKTKFTVAFAFKLSS